MTNSTVTSPVCPLSAGHSSPEISGELNQQHAIPDWLQSPIRRIPARVCRRCGHAKQLIDGEHVCTECPVESLFSVIDSPKFSAQFRLQLLERDIRQAATDFPVAGEVLMILADRLTALRSV